MPARKIYYGRDALLKAKEGIDGVANAVKQTLGYNGRTVIWSEPGFPVKTTKDGTSVASKIEFADEAMNAGAKLIKEISAKTGTEVGDGTTTVCVILQALIDEGMKLLDSGCNPVELKSGMQKACDFVCEELDKMKVVIGPEDINTLMQVAAVSANNDPEIGKIVGEIYGKIGAYGIVAIEDSKNEETYIEQISGYRFDSGWATHYFITDQSKNTCDLSNPYILMYEGKLERPEQVKGIMEQVARTGRPLVIFADDFDNNVLGICIQNHQSNVLPACCVKYNYIGDTKEDLINDLCAISGATLISDKLGKKIEQSDLSVLGESKRFVASRTDSTIIEGNVNESSLEMRVKDAEIKIESAKHPALKELMERRLAKLRGGIAICYVGGITEVERDEKRDRVEDSIKATKAAMEEGVVAGGGAALAKVSNMIYDGVCIVETKNESMALLAVKSSILMPIGIIISNSASENTVELLAAVLSSKKDIGFNARTAAVENLFESGILDPVKVVKMTVQNAVSGAIQFLNSNVLIVNDQNANQ